MTAIRSATEGDRAKVAESLASAFAEDPLFNWMAGAGPEKPLQPKMHTFFEAFLKLDLGRSDHLVFTDEECIGAAIWRAPQQVEGADR